MKPDFDILVVGGGMVGACFAALAAADRELLDLRIALLEARPPESAPDAGVGLRVSAISPASRRILHACGAWQWLPETHLSPYTDMIVWDAAGRAGGAASIHFSASDTSEPNLGHIVENRRVQWALYESRALRRVTVLRAELAGLAFEADAATVTLSDGRRVSASLVVGADGADSPSRRLAGLETAGWSYDQHAFVTHVRTERPHRSTAWQRFLPDGPIAFLPLADGRSSIVWSTRPEHALELVECSATQLGEALAQAIDGVLGEVTPDGPRGRFPLRLAHARSYVKERFALVGDAAHAMHPLAGQGVNLGFLDCAALVETLVDARRAGARVEALAELPVLRRYERWRKSENLLALGLIDGINRLFSTTRAPLGWIRRTGFTLVDASRPAKRALMGRAMGTAGELPRVVKSVELDRFA